MFSAVRKLPSFPNSFIAESACPNSAVFRERKIPLDETRPDEELFTLRSIRNKLNRILEARTEDAPENEPEEVQVALPDTVNTRDFKRFFEENKQWLAPYAQYCHLRDTYGTADYTQWPDHNVFDEADRTALESPRTKLFKEVSYFYFVQFILNNQMQAAHQYARQKGVILKGDIPIGVNRFGCDAWQEPRYFNLNGQAGAPPDDFSANGQNWGFPTYNWDEMLKDGCRWWVRRFANMAKFFDAYRIDHVLGFFRIWEIPVDSVHGLLGQFQPALGMTREEIEAYGLPWEEQLFLEPYIRDWVLDRMFGEKAQYVKDNFLVHQHDEGNGRRGWTIPVRHEISLWHVSPEERARVLAADEDVEKPVGRIAAAVVANVNDHPGAPIAFRDDGIRKRPR